MFSCYSVSMSETKQVSVAASKEVWLRFSVWCKIYDMTQEQAFEKLVMENVPNPFIKLQE